MCGGNAERRIRLIDTSGFSGKLRKRGAMVTRSCPLHERDLLGLMTRKITRTETFGVVEGKKSSSQLFKRRVVSSLSQVNLCRIY